MKKEQKPMMHKMPNTGMMMKDSEMKAMMNPPKASKSAGKGKKK